MTTDDADAAPASPIPPPAGDVRRLVRRRDDRVVSGVCAALGAYTDIDPVIYRVVLAVLVLFGGAGLVLYAIGWLFIPELETGRAPVDAIRAPTTPGRNLWIVVVAVIVGLVLVGLADNRGSRAGALLAALAVLGVLALRERRTDPPAPGPYPPVPAESGAGSYAVPPLGASPPAAPPRPPSPLGTVTLCAALIAVGAGLLLDRFGALHATLQGLLALALLVVGAGLVVGARLGRARWLILPALLLAAGLAAASLLHGVPLRGGTGDRHWSPVSAVDLHPSYRLRAGDATLDLSTVGPLPATRTVKASVGVGALEVQVPVEVPVSVHARAGAGRVELFGGITDGFRADRVASLPDPRTPHLDLDLQVGIGSVTVTHVAP